MKYFATIAISLFAATVLLAQPGPDTLWTRRYGGSSSDWGQAVQQTTDSGFVVVGTTLSFGFGVQDMYVVKTNTRGDTLWTRTYGGLLGEYANAVQQISDGGYVVAGVTYSFVAEGGDVYLVRLDNAGDTLWTHTYGQALYDGAIDIDTTSDGGFILAGWSSEGGPQQMYLVKTDRGGVAEWSRTYGGIYYARVFSVRQTSDGGYILAGESENSGGGDMDIYIVKTDASGDTTWTRTYPTPGNQSLESVRQTLDGGYILAGYMTIAGQSRMYLLKTNAAGDTLWTKIFGAAFRVAHSVAQTSDGGYLVVGDATGPDNSRDVSVVKTDSNGDTVWTRTYGGPLQDSGKDIALTYDGGAAVVGYWGEYDTPASDFYLVRLSSVTSDVEQHFIPHPLSFVLSSYPNPFNASTTLSYALDRTGAVDLVVYNLLGERTATLVNGIREAGAHSVIWNAEDYPSGVYFAKLKAGQNVRTVKVVLVK
jgi:hypothetical protein